MNLLCELLKYVDDSTTYESISLMTPEDSIMQENLNLTKLWTDNNKMKINTSKTKEMIINMSTKPIILDKLSLNNTELETVHTYKLVGVTISDDMTWKAHIDTIVKKNNTKIYYLNLLRRAGVKERDLVHFYTTVIRPSIEYAAPVWGTNLPEYLLQNLELLQKRALKIIFPLLSYEDALEHSHILKIKDRIDDTCRAFFNKVQDKQDKLHSLLTEENNTLHNTRHKKKYSLPQCNTNRFKHSFIPYSLFNYQ